MNSDLIDLILAARATNNHFIPREDTCSRIGIANAFDVQQSMAVINVVWSGHLAAESILKELL